MQTAIAPTHTETASAFCPHCMLPVAEGTDGEWPPAPTRCPHCRLMIGAGRARAEGDGTPGARGAGVAFVAFSGGPGRAREAYLTGGRRFFRIALPIIYVGLGIAVPAVVIANRHAAEGGVGTLVNHQPSKQMDTGKRLFRQTCASCHSLAAVNARGVTGPNLDQ